jgi:adenosylhomocysteine nucleosidase
LHDFERREDDPAFAPNGNDGLAQARGIPFAVLRAVSDDADTSLPRHATNPDGRAHIQSMLEALRAEPSQFFDLHKTAFEFVRAIGRLYDAYRVIGPDFCFQ